MEYIMDKVQEEAAGENSEPEAEEERKEPRGKMTGLPNGKRQRKEEMGQGWDKVTPIR